MKNVWKFIPVSPYDPVRMEEWLGEMAARGLLLRKPLPFISRTPMRQWAGFSRAEPHPARRYRLVPAPSRWEYPSREQRDLYEASGWQFVHTIDLPCITYFVFFTDDPLAQEPYTDSDSLRLALRAPLRESLSWVVFYLFLILLRILLRAWELEQESHPLNQPVSLLLILLWGLVGLDLLISWISVLVFRRLLKGSADTRPVFPRTFSITQFFLSLLPTVICTLMLLLVLSTLLFNRSDIPLSQWSPDFPLLTLEEMAGDGSWDPEPDSDVTLPGLPTLHLRYNCADIYYPFFPSPVRVQYRVDQTGTWSRGSTHMDLEYSIAWSRGSAERYLDGLTQWLLDEHYHRSVPGSLPLQSREIPGAEEFLFRREGEDWEVLARRGERVLLLTYSGQLDLSGWFHEIAAMLVPQ